MRISDWSSDVSSSDRLNLLFCHHKGKFSRTFPGFSGLHRAICSEQIVIECADKRSEEPCLLGSGVDFCWKVLGRLEFFQLLCFDRSSAPFHHAAAVLAPALAPAIGWRSPFDIYDVVPVVDTGMDQVYRKSTRLNSSH